MRPEALARTMTDPTFYPRLRYRRFGGGYRRAEVLLHLRELEAKVRRLEAELASARERSHELATELTAARAENALHEARRAQVEQALKDADRRASDVVAAAEARARAVLAEADEQAARIRGDAHLKVDDIGKQLEQILRLRESMIASLRGVVQDVGLAIGRVERGEPVLGAQPGVSSRPQPQASASTEARAGDDDVVARHVELDAGPFGDFATLSAFERAVGSLPNVVDVYVRRFAGGRATVEVDMAVEQPLVSLLRAALPYAFEAERGDDGTIRISIAAPSLAGSG